MAPDIVAACDDGEGRPTPAAALLMRLVSCLRLSLRAPHLGGVMSADALLGVLNVALLLLRRSTAQSEAVSDAALLAESPVQLQIIASLLRLVQDCLEDPPGTKHESVTAHNRASLRSVVIEACTHAGASSGASAGASDDVRMAR